MATSVIRNSWTHEVVLWDGEDEDNMSMNIIPSAWDTKRLKVQDLVVTEIQMVQELYEKGSYIHQWDGHDLDNGYVHRCFTNGDLPPNGTKDHFKIQVIRMKETELIVGLLTIYLGYPNPGTVYVSYLYIDQEYQKQGLGQEVINELWSILKRTGYDEVRANVALKKIGPLLDFGQNLGLIR